MKTTDHIAFYVAHDGDKQWLMHHLMKGKSLHVALGLDQLTGAIFSNETLQYFIDEELRHDRYEIKAGINNTLSASSSGEQRKALLSYIIDKRPGYIIIDGLLESLDKLVGQSMLHMLTSISGHTRIIQLMNRKTELLPFVKVIYILSGQSLNEPLEQQSFLKNSVIADHQIFAGAVPPPLEHYTPVNNPLVKMNNVNVQFNDRPVLKDICWEINAGEFWQLTGPNGSGKSTLLSLITGNSPKGYGQDLVLFGRRKGSGESVWEIKKKIGYFAPTMTMHFERLDSVEQMIMSGFFDSVGLYIKPSDSQVQLAREWLALLGFDKDRHKPFRFLPQGHQRMIMIARSMVKHPPLLILDEPVAGLDDEMAVLFTTLIQKIAAETNTAILYVSHLNERGIVPEKIFTLTPHENGSVGSAAYA